MRMNLTVNYLIDDLPVFFSLSIAQTLLIAVCLMRLIFFIRGDNDSFLEMNFYQKLPGNVIL